MPENHGPVFDYTVDGEPQSTSEHTLSPLQILRAAGINPASHYLVELKGDNQVSYEKDPNTSIHIHEHQKFISISNGPTPVSSDDQ
jgi:hypothetical protein